MKWRKRVLKWLQPKEKPARPPSERMYIYYLDHENERRQAIQTVQALWNDYKLTWIRAETAARWEAEKYARDGMWVDRNNFVPKHRILGIRVGRP